MSHKKRAVILVIGIPNLGTQYEEGMLNTCSLVLPFTKYPKWRNFVMF